MSVINKAFDIVAKSLLRIAEILHLSYNEINIIVYYFIVPLTWCVMIDLIISLPVFTPLWLLLWAGIFIAKGKTFRQWSDRVFKKSVDFLLWFRRIGWNYETASVIICVVLPVIIYAVLAYLLIGSCH